VFGSDLLSNMNDDMDHDNTHHNILDPHDPILAYLHLIQFDFGLADHSRLHGNRSECARNSRNHVYLLNSSTVVPRSILWKILLGFVQVEGQT